MDIWKLSNNDDVCKGHCERVIIQVIIVMRSGQIFGCGCVWGLEIWSSLTPFGMRPCLKSAEHYLLSENLPEGLWNSVNGMTGSQTDFHSSTTETCKDLQTQQDETCSAEPTYLPLICTRVFMLCFYTLLYLYSYFIIIIQYFEFAFIFIF